jgi:hypothetical protein
MPPDFLNSREDALMLWALLILSYLVYKDPRGTVSSACDLIRPLMVPKLLLLLGSAAVYSAGLVLVAERLGLWHTTSLKETIYWFVGSAVVLTARAVNATPSSGYLGEVLRHALSLTIIVTFLANFYVFPLAYEIVFVFVVLVLTLGAAVSEAAGEDPTAGRVMNRGLIGLGLFVLLTFAARAALDSGELFTRETGEHFLVVPVLTLALTPYLFGVAWYCRREVANVRRRLGLQL